MKKSLRSVFVSLLLVAAVAGTMPVFSSTAVKDGACNQYPDCDALFCWGLFVMNFKYCEDTNGRPGELALCTSPFGNQACSTGNLFVCP